jgi:hypothetical protein
MSIPERLWRLVKGRWVMTDDRYYQEAGAEVSEKHAEASAYEELAEALRRVPPIPVEERADHTRVLPQYAPPKDGHDPLEAAYALLDVQPGCDLASLEAAYEKRMAEIRPDRHPAGSPERAALEGRRSAVQAAYDRLRDALNPTETRFEHIEF